MKCSAPTLLVVALFALTGCTGEALTWRAGEVPSSDRHRPAGVGDPVVSEVRQDSAASGPTIADAPQSRAFGSGSGRVPSPEQLRAATSSPAALTVVPEPVSLPQTPVNAAVLHIGRPSYQAEYSRNLLGVHVTAESLVQTIPLLEADQVAVVILEVNCQGGYWSEASRIQAVIEEEFIPRFRTVVWIHEAVSAAAMCMIAVPELYYQPAGVLGACPGWVHQSTPELTASDPILLAMEAAAIRGGRAFEPVRSMLLAEPLSVRIRANGAVVWQQDELASRVLNHSGHVYTMNASDAVKYGFARGCCSDIPSLLSSLGLQNATLVGDAATRILDDSMAAARADEVLVAELLTELRAAIRLADSAIEGPERTFQVDQALAALTRLRAIIARNPAYARFFAGDASVPESVGGMNKVWFDAIYQGIDRLRRKTYPLDEVAEGEVG